MPPLPASPRRPGGGAASPRRRKDDGGEGELQSLANALCQAGQKKRESQQKEIEERLARGGGPAAAAGRAAPARPALLSPKDPEILSAVSVMSPSTDAITSAGHPPAKPPPGRTSPYGGPPVDPRIAAWEKVVRDLQPEKKAHHAAVLVRYKYGEVLSGRLARGGCFDDHANNTRVRSTLNVELERALGHAGLDTCLLSTVRIEEAAKRSLARQGRTKKAKEEQQRSKRGATPPGFALMNPAAKLKWQLEKLWTTGREADRKHLRDLRRWERQHKEFCNSRQQMGLQQLRKLHKDGDGGLAAALARHNSKAPLPQPRRSSVGAARDAGERVVVDLDLPHMTSVVRMRNNWSQEQKADVEPRRLPALPAQRSGIAQPRALLPPIDGPDPRRSSRRASAAADLTDAVYIKTEPNSRSPSLSPDERLDPRLLRSGGRGNERKDTVAFTLPPV